MVSKVAHFAALDVHPRLPHVFPGSAVARLAVVSDDLRDGADVRSTIVFVRVGAVGKRVPRKHLAHDG